MPFDTILIIDWSAAAKPKRGADSIWIARLDMDKAEPIAWNPPSRADAIDDLAQLFSAEPERRFLAGFDFPFGYPAGFAAAIGLPPDALAVWRELERRVLDGDAERNRFAVAAELNQHCAERGPFWGHPATQKYAGLTPRQKGFVDYPTLTHCGEQLAEYRLAERTLRENRYAPQSPWKLTGAGSVGSQALVGIPWLQKLRARFPTRIRVWPFETGLTVPRTTPGDIVFAEAWPSMSPFHQEDGRCKDEKQVRALAKHCAERLSSDKGLAHLFSPNLTAAQKALCEREESWVMGWAP